MDHPQSKLHYEFQKKKKKKISNTTKQNDNTLETTTKKKKCKCKNRIGKDIDKNINNTYDQASSSMAD